MYLLGRTGTLSLMQCTSTAVQVESNRRTLADAAEAWLLTVALSVLSCAVGDAVKLNYDSNMLMVIWLCLEPTSSLTHDQKSFRITQQYTSSISISRTQVCVTPAHTYEEYTYQWHAEGVDRSRKGWHRRRTRTRCYQHRTGSVFAWWLIKMKHTNKIAKRS